MFEGLGELPRAAELLGFGLQVAAGEIDADAVAIDAVERLFGGYIGAAGLQGQHAFDLEMHVIRQRRIGEILAGEEIVGVLLEEEGRLAVRIMAHFDGVIGIIAADAIDAADREGLGAAFDGQENGLRQGDDGGGKGHGGTSWLLEIDLASLATSNFFVKHVAQNRSTLLLELLYGAASSCARLLRINA